MNHCQAAPIKTLSHANLCTILLSLCKMHQHTRSVSIRRLLPPLLDGLTRLTLYGLQQARLADFCERLRTAAGAMHVHNCRCGHTTGARRSPAAAISAGLPSSSFVLYHPLRALLVQDAVAAVATPDHVPGLDGILRAAVAAQVGHAWRSVEH